MKWNRSKIESDTEEARSRTSGGKLVLLKDGQEIIGRFLPASKPKGDDGEIELYVKFGTHYIKEEYVTCLNEDDVKDLVPDGGDCYYCELYAELRKSKDTEDQEAAATYKVGIKYNSNFKPKDSAEIKIFPYGTKTLPKITELGFGREYGDILELKDGRDVKISRRGSGLDTEYHVVPMPKTYTIPTSILDQLNDLWAEIKIWTPKQMKAIAEGKAVKEDELKTVRDYIGDGAKKSSTPKAANEETPEARPAARATVSPLIKKRTPVEPEPEDTKPAVPSGAIGKKEKATITELCELLGLEIDFDNDGDDIRSALVEEVIGSSIVVKKLTDDVKEWLELMGLDCSGKTVAKKEEDEAGDIERQIDAVRRARNKK